MPKQIHPPYGERISTPNLLNTYKMIGERFKRAFAGNEAWAPSPLAESNLMRTSREATDEFSARPFVKLNEVFSSLVERTYIKYVP